MAVEVVDNPDEARYEIRTDGELAGFAQYRLHDGTITFSHTEIDPAHQGEHLGQELAREALDDVKSRDLVVVPLCPFISAFIKRHPVDYLKLVEPSLQSKVMAHP